MRQGVKPLLGALIFVIIVYLAYFSSHTRADRSTDLIEVTVATLLDTGSGSVVLLKESSGDRYLPIAIGDPETRAIVLGLERLRGSKNLPVLERPLTHDLLLDVMTKLGARVDHIAVSDLKNSTYYADIYLKVSGNREIKIDSRPSDAIALSVTMAKPVPIYVTRGLMARAGKKGSRLLDPDENEKKKILRL